MWPPKSPPDATEEAVAAPEVPALTLDVQTLLTAGLGSPHVLRGHSTDEKEELTERNQERH